MMYALSAVPIFAAASIADTMTSVLTISAVSLRLKESLTRIEVIFAIILIIRRLILRISPSKSALQPVTNSMIFSKNN